MPYISKLPGSKNVGVLEGFPFDDDGFLENDDYYFESDVESMAWDLATTEYDKKNPRLKWPKYGSKNYDAKIKLYYKWDNERNAAIKVTKFLKQAEKIVRKRMDSERQEYLSELKKQIEKSKFCILMATTNATSQKSIEKILPDLGFKRKLKFTNPNHYREDNLHVWILKR